MASITKRLAKGCIRPSWRLQIRRTGVPSFYMTFVSYEDAVEWAEKNEEKYIRNPDPYIQLFRERYNGERLRLLRERHFKNRKDDK